MSLSRPVPAYVLAGLGKARTVDSSTPTRTPSRGTKRPAVEYGNRRGAASEARRAKARVAAVPTTSQADYLRLSSVTSATLKLYERAVQDFEWWRKERHLTGRRDDIVDKQLEKYFASNYFRGKSPHLSRCALYGWILLRTDHCDAKGTIMQRARRALIGYTNRDPGTVRDPWPIESVYLMGLHALDQPDGDLLAAAMVVQTDTYCRPGELLHIRSCDFYGPQRFTRGRNAGAWAVSFAPSDTNFKTKTGQQDDTVMVGVKGRRWIASVAAELQRITKSASYVFPFDLRTYERKFELVKKKAGLGSLKGSPHTLRHTGPSQDSFAYSMPLAEIKKRGRWSSDKSVGRYERHAKLLRVSASIPMHVQNRLATAGNLLATKLLAKLRSRPTAP